MVHKINFEEIIKRMETTNVLAVYCETGAEAADLTNKLYTSPYQSIVEYNPIYVGNKLLHGSFSKHTIAQSRYDILVGSYAIKDENIYQYDTGLFKTWEVLQKLSTNPKKVFQRISDGLEITTNEEGELRWKPGYDYLKPNELWEEYIKEPVSFEEALTSFKNGSNISSQLNGEESLYLNNIPQRIVDSNGVPLTVEEIFDGEWFIEN